MINRAFNLALKSKQRQRHSCLILKGGSLLAQASNNKGHAEQVALGISVQAKLINNEINFQKVTFIDFVIDYKQHGTYKGCTLISLRIKPDGMIGNSKPCQRCEIAIEKAGIRKVIYFTNGKWKEEIR